MDEHRTHLARRIAEEATIVAIHAQRHPVATGLVLKHAQEVLALAEAMVREQHEVGSAKPVREAHRED